MKPVLALLVLAAALAVGACTNPSGGSGTPTLNPVTSPDPGGSSPATSPETSPVASPEASPS